MGGSESDEIDLVSTERAMNGSGTTTAAARDGGWAQWWVDGRRELATIDFFFFSCSLSMFPNLTGHDLLHPRRYLPRVYGVLVFYVFMAIFVLLL